MPEIQLGPAEGRLIELLLRLTKARKVVEIGTLAGYSALWIARALPPGGHLWTIEANPKHAGVAAEVIGEAGFGDRVTIVRDDAAEILPKLRDSGPFCAVFLDADKGRYDLYGRWATENLRSGGLLIGDNAYLFGRLLEDSDEARAMRRFHEEMAVEFDSVCVPTPDGLAVGVKVAPNA
jgi:caffeoyl-CoA O-methyltransferase